MFQHFFRTVLPRKPAKSFFKKRSCKACRAVKINAQDGISIQSLLKLWHQHIVKEGFTRIITFIGFARSRCSTKFFSYAQH